MGAGNKGLDLKLFHEQACYEKTNGGTHNSNMDLFIKLTLEEEVCVFKENSMRVTICGMGMLDLCDKVGSCTNFVGLCGWRG